ncbi:catalase family peroxidase [Hansschlegelia quercus]|uniref:Catalase-related peroxidase n=1 Tax=Hansschlegelia quercus TaxID=2528245 RepID=A0A4Q9GM24_9HYPH|nr:catalase family peroxidase [Hansschlegelia quercus]TBN54481.1 catalase family peroxidase [Hansschlegelia quercus]
MADPTRSRSLLASLTAIGFVVGGGAAAFAYTAGWLSPDRLTPAKVVDAFAPPGGPALGHRRNHAKGVCFTGSFESNGAGAELSKAQVFEAGRYPVVGRFNFGTPSPVAPDAKARVRGFSVRISTPDGQEWRSAQISAPVFPVSTPQAFYELLQASGSKAPEAMKNFAATHPEIAGFGGWTKTAPWTASYAEERYNGLNSFIFTDAGGKDRAVRWSWVPEAPPVSVPADDIAKRGPDFLQEEITQRIAAGPARWTLVVTVADPGDPTADPSKAWPADRRTVEVGKLIADKVEPEADGPCRDVNFDPTVLPLGIRTSDDPFPAARSAAYAVSFDRRTAEAKDYPAK